MSSNEILSIFFSLFPAATPELLIQLYTFYQIFMRFFLTILRRFLEFSGL